MLGRTKETELQIFSEEFEFPSTDGTSTCRGTLWQSSREPKMLLQISHGMCEHIVCYERFALDMVRRGFAVYGIDHIGHGKTQPDTDLRGVYDPREGANHIIEDQHEARLYMAKRFQGIPLVLLGHSMGSFVARCYIARHGEDLAAAIVMGTGWMPSATIKALQVLVNIIGRTRGWNYRSALIDGMGTGGYNKAFAGTGANTGYEWLSRDEQKAIAYRDDPDCGWMFSVSGYYMLSQLMTEDQDQTKINHIPQDLPVLIISGDQDPVGENGRGPAAVYSAFQKAGIKDVTLDLVEGARHEVLNETNREEVIEDIALWIEKHARH